MMTEGIFWTAWLPFYRFQNPVPGMGDAGQPLASFAQNRNRICFDYRFQDNDFGKAAGRRYAFFSAIPDR